jgi:hypothetical protein
MAHLNYIHLVFAVISLHKDKLHNAAKHLLCCDHIKLNFEYSLDTLINSLDLFKKLYVYVRCLRRYIIRD